MAATIPSCSVSALQSTTCQRYLLDFVKEWEQWQGDGGLRGNGGGGGGGGFRTDVAQHKAK
jgi:hypothetical protein